MEVREREREREDMFMDCKRDQFCERIMSDVVDDDDG